MTRSSVAIIAVLAALAVFEPSSAKAQPPTRGEVLRDSSSNESERESDSEREEDSEAREVKDESSESESHSGLALSSEGSENEREREEIDAPLEGKFEAVSIDAFRDLLTKARAEEGFGDPSAANASAKRYNEHPIHQSGRMDHFERLTVGRVSGRLAQHAMNIFSVLSTEGRNFADHTKAFAGLLKASSGEKFQGKLREVSTQLDQQLGAEAQGIFELNTQKDELLASDKPTPQKVRESRQLDQRLDLASSRYKEIEDARASVDALTAYADMIADLKKEGRDEEAAVLEKEMRQISGGFIDNLTGEKKKKPFKFKNLETRGGENAEVFVLNYNWETGKATKPRRGEGDAIFKPEGELEDADRISGAKLRLRNDAAFRSGLRQEMTYIFAKAFGMEDIVPRTKFVNIEGRVGVVQEMADGAPPRSDISRPTERPTDDFAEAAKTENLWRNLNRAEWLDLMSGQVDRHPGNYFITKDGGVFLIDSDQAQGHNEDPFLDTGTLPPAPKFIPRDLLGYFKRMNPAEVRRLGAGRLNSREQDALVARFERLKELALTLEARGAVIGDLQGPFGRRDGRWLDEEVISSQRTGTRYYQMADQDGANYDRAFPEAVD